MLMEVTSAAAIMCAPTMRTMDYFSPKKFLLCCPDGHLRARRRSILAALVIPAGAQRRAGIQRTFHVGLDSGFGLRPPRNDTWAFVQPTILNFGIVNPSFG